ncbi:ABC transporter ATP-binding protein [Gephyromycinifex aptenodytis]|uniref:ABC transporter ATP-binding protein n=1 Tax=Gephyromycinifex aptenodytis TaxID=2716227 RepID=UPI001446138F|nr:ATP-binding cassette domain-containing protein [Gephyromycinifex aptenodytis]
MGDEVRANEQLVAHSIQVSRRELLLVDELDLALTPGQTLALVGPSGAGKTSLLRTLAGLSPPQHGTVTRPAGRIGLVFQEPRLLPWRSALDNVALALHGPREQRRATARTWLRGVHLDEAAANLRPARLSGGMRQRVSIARALAIEPTLVFVDEPFSALDRALAEELRADLSKLLTARRCITVWITHDPREAQEIADLTLTLSGPPTGAWTLTTSPAPKPLALL